MSDKGQKLVHAFSILEYIRDKYSAYPVIEETHPLDRTSGELKTWYLYFCLDRCRTSKGFTAETLSECVEEALRHFKEGKR